MTNESKFPWWGWVAVLCFVPVGYVLSCLLLSIVADDVGLEFRTVETYHASLICVAEEWDWFLSFCSGSQNELTSNQPFPNPVPSPPPPQQK